MAIYGHIYIYIYGCSLLSAYAGCYIYRERERARNRERERYNLYIYIYIYISVSASENISIRLCMIAASMVGSASRDKRNRSVIAQCTLFLICATVCQPCGWFGRSRKCSWNRFSSSCELSLNSILIAERASCSASSTPALRFLRR